MDTNFGKLKDFCERHTGFSSVVYGMSLSLVQVPENTNGASNYKNFNRLQEFIKLVNLLIKARYYPRPDIPGSKLPSMTDLGKWKLVLCSQILALVGVKTGIWGATVGLFLIRWKQ